MISEYVSYLQNIFKLDSALLFYLPFSRAISGVDLDKLPSFGRKKGFYFYW
jgi:hypothetical protein